MKFPRAARFRLHALRVRCEDYGHGKALSKKGSAMTKQDLMKQLESAIDEAIRTEMWGVIEVSFSGGVPAILRQEKTTKLTGGNERTHANRNYR